MRRAPALCALFWLLPAASLLAQVPDQPAPTAPALDPTPEATTATDVTPPPVSPADAAGSGDPTPSPPPGSEPTAPLTPEELKALGFTVPDGDNDAAAVDTSLHVFGFLDFSISKLIAKESSLYRVFLPAETSFYVGNFNLYLSKNLTKRFRTMAEVRFLYMPNGDIPLSNGVGTPTTRTQDYADFQRPLHWGGIEIERVYLELLAHRFVSIRAGQFLTPYGIWNIDHGSPTVIPTQRPYVVGDALFPERQTGFEVFGRWDLTDRGTLGYHLTLSNGQGPVTEYRDLDGNKAVGGRLFWEQQQALGSLRFGGSAYYGRSTDAMVAARVTPEGRVRPKDVVYDQHDALSLALDAVWRYRGLIVQAEWISRQRAWTERGRAAKTLDTVQQTVLPSDSMSWGVYGLVGYRLPWLGIMPYYVGQYLDSTTPNGTRSEVTNMQFGLNIRPIDVVVFKIEYSYAFFARPLLGSDDPIQFFQTQIAWAF